MGVAKETLLQRQRGMGITDASLAIGKRRETRHS